MIFQLFDELNVTICKRRKLLGINSRFLVRIRLYRFNVLTYRDVTTY